MHPFGRTCTVNISIIGYISSGKQPPMPFFTHFFCCSVWGCIAIFGIGNEIGFTCFIACSSKNRFGPNLMPGDQVGLQPLPNFMHFFDCGAGSGAAFFGLEIVVKCFIGCRSRLMISTCVPLKRYACVIPSAYPRSICRDERTTGRISVD